MNIKKKLNSINFKTLAYLIGFSVGILLLLWLIQIVFFKIFYEKYQITSMTNLAHEIYNVNESEIFTKIENMSFDSSICLEYIDGNGKIFYFNNRVNGCLLGKNNSLDKYINQIKESKEDLKAIKLVNPFNDSSSLLYGVKVGSGRIYLFTALEDIGSTSSMLKGQLIYVTLLAILFSVIIAWFLSRKIAKPITNITDKARRLADGNYDVNFEKSGILEIDNLAEALNYMEGEVSKTDEYRRDLMANVSHDLKTPLTMIKAYAEMVRDISYKDKKKREEHLNVIIDEADRLNVLVNDILDLSKLQSSVGDLTKESFCLNDLILEVLKRYDIIKETENYNIVFENKDKIMVVADRKRIEQVLYNLINNAINYTGEDKTVTIKISDKKKVYRVEVIDTGKGIDKDDLLHIWDKYYKKEKNHKRNVIGTGLGLSIVKNILEAHEFNYGVDSKKGVGSNFYFEISKDVKH